MILSHIDLRKLRHVEALAKAGSFVGAADDLNLTQSALTRSIQSIESEIGIRIFDRARKGVRLTAAGKLFLDRAQVLLADADDLARFAARVRNADAGQVSFGLTIAPAKFFLTPLMLHLLAAKPEIRCSATVRNPDELFDMLLKDKIEFFLGSYVPQVSDHSLEVSDLARLEPAFVARRGHPLLEKQALTYADMEPYPLLLSMYDPGHAPQRPFVSRHRQVISSDDYSTLMRLVLEGDAVWFSSVITGREAMHHPDIVRLPFEIPGEKEQVMLKSIRLARRTLSPLASQVLAAIGALCAQ